MSKPLPSPVTRNTYSPNTTPTSAYTPNTPTFSPQSAPSNPFPQGQYNQNQKAPLYNPSSFHGNNPSRVNPTPNPQVGNQQAQQGQHSNNNQTLTNSNPNNPQLNQKPGYNPQQFQQGQQQGTSPSVQPPRINTQFNNQSSQQNQMPTSNPNMSSPMQRTSDRMAPNSNYTPNAYPQANQMPTSNPNISNPMQRTSDRMAPVTTSQPLNSNTPPTTPSSTQQRAVAPKMPAVNPLLANSLKFPLKNPNLKTPMKMPTPVAPEIIEVAREKFELINYTLTAYDVEYLEDGRIIPKTTTGTFPIPEILPKPSKEDLVIVRFPKIGEPMVLQAPKPRSAKKNPAATRANSFSPKEIDVGKNARKEELGVPEPKDERRASESRAAEITRQHVRPAITRTDSDMSLGADTISPRNQTSTSPRYDTNPRVRALGTGNPSASPGKPTQPGITRINSTPNFNFQVRIEAQESSEPLQSPTTLTRPSKPQYKSQAYQPQAYQPQAYHAPDSAKTTDQKEAPTTFQIQQMQMEKQLEFEKSRLQQQGKDCTHLEADPQYQQFVRKDKDKLVHRVSKGSLAIGMKEVNSNK